MYDASYMRDIDYYFMEKSAGGTPPVPSQSMPPKIRELISALQDSRLAGRFEAGSIILSMSSAARTQLENGLGQLETGRSAGRPRTIRMPFPEGALGLSITHAGETLLREELTRSVVQMKRAGCDRWVVIQLADRANLSVTRIELITPNRFSDDELRSSEKHLENQVQGMIASRKPKPNDQCPCGSGRKFKKCHGS